MTADLPPLIRALLQPQRYPGALQRVELVETHISWVLLAGDFAYKIKKPLKLAFLDFSTLARRQQACQEELRLNRRLAPELYLGVLPICHSAQDPQLGGAGPPIEYAVHMRRFDEAGRLDHLCARGELLPAHLSDLAHTLVAFHASAAQAPAQSRFGQPAQVLAPMLDNFTDLFRWLPTLAAATPGTATAVAHTTPVPDPVPDPLATLGALHRWTLAKAAQWQPLMQARQHGGYVRECHGDLHLGNLVLVNGRVTPFDCLEFNEDLRWIDVASDIAFTYVDLLAQRQPGLANWFIDAALSASGDYPSVPLLRFYAVYRCLVRAKVAAIRAQQTGASAADVVQQLALATQLTVERPPRLLITHGLSGCGKTFVSDRLLQSDAQPPTLRLRADVLRKHLFGLPSQARSGAALNSGLYSADAHRQTYDHLHQLAAQVLRAGWSVLVDATFLKRADRDHFRALAQTQGAPFALLAPSAPPELLRQRILSRAALGQDASEATLAVLAQQQTTLEPLGPDEQALLLTE